MIESKYKLITFCKARGKFYYSPENFSYSCLLSALRLKSPFSY